MKRARTEHPLGPGYLSVKKLVADTGSITIRFSQWPANTGKQDFLHEVSNEKLFIFSLRRPHRKLDAFSMIARLVNDNTFFIFGMQFNDDLVEMRRISSGASEFAIIDLT
ncbi:MAG: hypothetical protein A3F90_06765 [Deltaproteobacteria bacterium RIFCSPLOWO2_12_FULL_60_19]|nr:MAG: hypothetical protein A3F90_06765 [Deltaproteobacteria bacterium RIFCSPLOWO2_12_FULL_60_19]